MRYLFTISLFLLVVGCHRSKVENTDYIRIPVREENLSNDRVLMSDLVAVEEVIQLETCREGLIGLIDKIVITDSSIFVLDEWRGKCIYIFNRTGKFIGKIKSPGKGPSDLLNPTDIIWDSTRGELLVLDPACRKFNTYDMYGTFIRTRPIHLQCSNFDMIGKDRLVFAAEDEYSFYLSDLQGNVLQKFLPFQMAFQSTQPKPLIRDAAIVYALRFMDDTIYRITPTGIEPAIVIDYGGHALSRKAYLDIPVTGMDRLIDKRYMTGNSFFSINSTHAFFWMSYNGKSYLNIFNTKTSRISCHNVQSITNDLFFGAARIRSFSNTWNDQFSGTILPSELDSGISLKFKEKEYKTSADDNPLLFLFSLKT